MLDEIDPIYFNHSYFIGPGENGGKAYALLRESLQKSGKIGIAEITIRSKQHMEIIRTYNNSLIMETMYYPDEVRNADEVPGVPENTNINEKELNTPIMLIDQLTTTFEPEIYKDDYRTALMSLIDEKVHNNERKTAQEAPRTNVADLICALQASIEKTNPKITMEPNTQTPPDIKAIAKTRTTRKKVSGYSVLVTSILIFSYLRSSFDRFGDLNFDLFAFEGTIGPLW